MYRQSFTRSPAAALCAVVAALVLLSAPACDNIGRLWDPTVDPTGPAPTTGESIVQVVPEGGDARDGRPLVKSIAPEDGGWPTVVPIVIEFNESVNQASIAPTTPTGTDGRIILRVVGTTQPLPCLYDFLAGGRVLVMRPINELSDEQSPSYEVVLLPEARDVDGVRFSVDDESGDVLTTFQVNQTTTITDGRVLATYPRDNQRDAARETDYFVIFDRPANLAAVTASNVVIRPAGGSAVAGTVELALDSLQPEVKDGRVAQFTPGTPFAGGARFELVVDDTITFGADGRLDFRGRTPYAEFDTIGPQAPTAVTVGNPTMGFPDQINRANLASVMLSVTTPTDSVVGDTVVARIYGFDPSTSTVGDIAFVERTATVPAPGGQQVVTVDFSGTLGSFDSPVFEDGGVDFAVQVHRGDQQSGYFLNDPDAEPRVDITPPTLTAAGPPGSGTDIYTDLEQLVFHGTASEEIGEAILSDGVNPDATLFGAAADGFFTMNPVALGRLAAPRPYTLTLTDRAGNMIETPVAGNIVQRGAVTGGAVAGTLVVEAYDDATLAPLASATVVVDPGLPTVPATGQLVMTTDANGLATFSGLATTRHTITIVAAGYGLTTFYDTAAARVSLPLRPLTGATATFSGNAVFDPAGGTTALIGNNAFADPLALSTATTTAEPTTIPSTPILANRAQVVTAFGGRFEPTGVPAFTAHGYAMLGPTLLTNEASAPPVAGGETERTNVVLLPTNGLTNDLAATYTKDFALATGLDTGNLVGSGPTVRIMASLSGFTGQSLAGVGFATNTTGASYTVNATYGLPMVTGYSTFTPSFWVATEARDTGGRVSRHRALLVTLTGAVLDVTNPPGVPVITAPSGPSMGSPLVMFADELDAASVPGGIAIAELTATDGDGRPWTILRLDGDGTGGTENVQFPDLSMAGATGLATGVWNVQVESRVLLSLTASTFTDFVLTERRRQEASYARSAAQEFTVQ